MGLCGIPKIWRARLSCIPSPSSIENVSISWPCSLMYGMITMYGYIAWSDNNIFRMTPLPVLLKMEWWLSPYALVTVWRGAKHCSLCETMKQNMEISHCRVLQNVPQQRSVSLQRLIVESDSAKPDVHLTLIKEVCSRELGKQDLRMDTYYQCNCNIGDVQLPSSLEILDCEFWWKALHDLLQSVKRLPNMVRGLLYKERPTVQLFEGMR